MSQATNENGRGTLPRDEAGLRFDKPGGPLVAVCGLHGGAGTSTLAYALAHRAAAESEAQVLLVETAGSEGDQSVLADVSPLFNLGIAQRARKGTPMVAKASGVTHADVHADRLCEAAPDNGLTVIDAGTARFPGTRVLLAASTHIVWVTLAQPKAADVARRQLRRMPAFAAHQALVVRSDGRAARNRSRAGELRKLAEDFCDRLIYMSDSPGTSDTTVDLDDRRMLAALTGLAGFLGAGAEA